MTTIKSARTIRTKTPDEVTFQQVATPELSPGKVTTAEDIAVIVEARLHAAYQEALTTQRPELAEPYGWWDLFAIGPIQPGAGYYGVDGPPFLPHRVIRKGEKAYIVTILILNPFPLKVPPYGLIPCEVLSNFCLPFKLDYHTCDTTYCTRGPENLNVCHEGQLKPGKCFYVDVLCFEAEKEGCIFETNICGRILGCHDEYGKECTAPPFAGFVRWVKDIDKDLFLGSPGLEFDNPVRFMVYD
ncbi:MAG: hypothetical protein MOB07_05835 [Acidobacteria bacterium]|nr:hypothetical protein [Acidobacteriota bacterium]